MVITVPRSTAMITNYTDKSSDNLLFVVSGMWTATRHSLLEVEVKESWYEM
jgi:hypothetical protein